MTPREERTRELLRLAREVSTTVAAFLVLADGDVIVEVQLEESSEELEGRVARLAMATFASASDPDVDEIIWNADPPAGGGGGPEPLACAAFRLGEGEHYLGLMGVADPWMPELDDDLWAALEQLATSMTSLLEASPSKGPIEAELKAGEHPAELAWTNSPEFLQEVAEHMPEALLVVRTDGSILYANASFAALSHRAPEEIIGREVSLVLSAASSPSELAEARLSSLLGAAEPPRRARLALPTGRYIAVDVLGQMLSSESVGDFYVAVVRDAREPGVAMDLPRLEVLEEIVESLDDGIIFCDSSGNVVLANRASRLLQGLAPNEQLVGRPFPVPSSLRDADGSPVGYEDHPLLKALHGTTVRSEHLVSDAQDDRRHLLVSARPFPMADSSGALVVIRDITAQLDEESRLMELALHDPLTGLANRYLLLDYLKRSLNQVQSRGGQLTLFYLDLDDFKSVNDDYGHDVGDEVLIAVARRLQGAARSSDIVARLSGDEFVVVTLSSANEAGGGVEVVTARIRAIFTAPYYVRGHSLFVGASVGWVLGDPREDPTSLLVRADREMYRRKRARRAGQGERAS